MFCRKCGASGVEGKFCRICGTPLIEPTAENNNLQENSNQQINNMQVPDFEANQNYVPYNPAMRTMVRKKKNHAPKVIAFIAVLLAVVVAGSLIFGNFFGGALMRIGSPEKYYQNIEKKNLATLTAHTSNIAELTGRGGTNTTLLLTLTDDGKGFMGDMDASWLGTILLDINSASDETRSYSGGTLNINNTKIIAFETLTELPGNEMFLKLPDFSQMYIKTNANSNYMKLFSASSPDMDALSKVIDRYGEIIINNLNKVEKNKETVTVGSTTAEYDALVVTIDSEISSNIAREIASAARDDREIEKLIRSSAESSGEDADAAYAEFLADLNEAENRDDTEENTVLATMTVYVDDKGEVCGRRYVSADTPDEVNYYITAWNGKDFETEANLATDDGILRITGIGSRSGDKISGDYTFRSDDILVSTVRVDDFDKNAAKGGKIYGSFTITPGKDYIDEKGSNPLTASLRYKIDMVSESGKMDATVTFLSDVTNLGTLQINVKAKKNVDIPSVGDGEKVDPETWLKSIDTEQASQTLKNALTNAGAPEEYFN